MSDAYRTELVMGSSHNPTFFFVGGGERTQKPGGDFEDEYLQIDTVNST